MINKEKTVKLCEESQMTLQQWFSFWKKRYLCEVIPQLVKLSERHDSKDYYVKFKDIITVLNEIE